MMKTWLSLALCTSLLAGCAGIYNISSEVSSFGEWPSGRAPGTYAFDRLPSQAAQAEETERLERAAAPALQKAGFQPVAAGQTPDVLVQVGARLTRADYSPWDDHLWFRGGFGHYGRRGPWMGPAWRIGGVWDMPRYDREVAVLIRDQASGKPIFESRAANESGGAFDSATLAAMYQAALLDFPKTGINPRRVVVQLPGSGS